MISKLRQVKELLWEFMRLEKTQADEFRSTVYKNKRGFAHQLRRLSPVRKTRITPGSNSFGNYTVRIFYGIAVFGMLFAIPASLTQTGRVEAVDVDLPILEQKAYIWENDDEDTSTGDDYDESSQIAAGDTAATSIQQGSRLALRVELENTGEAASGTDIALFYDREDGLWSKVKQHGEQQLLGTGNCDDTTFECDEVIDNGIKDNDGAFEVAYSPLTGQPWVAYTSSVDSDVWVAQHVGSGGTGCVGSNAAWSCELVDAGTSGKGAAIAFDDSGVPWITYRGSGNDLFVAQFVGDSGSGCDSDRWSCFEFDNSTTGGSVSITIDEDGDPWIAYVDIATRDALIAHHVGTGGSNCSHAAWTCEVLDANIGVQNGFDNDVIEVVTGNDGAISVIYADENTDDVRHAVRVGGGSGSGCSDADWDCTVVATDTSSYGYVDASVAPDGTIWAVTAGETDDDLIVMNQMLAGSGGNCDSAYSGSDAWECIVVDGTSNSAGVGASLEFAPDGRAWVSFQNATDGSVSYATYVGSSGSGCDTAAWDGCATLEDQTTTDAFFTDVGFDNNGTPWIFWSDDTNDLHVATIEVGNEILLANSPAAANGDLIQESHSDMTSTTDTANRDSADCSNGSATWNDGAVYESTQGSFTIADGTTTAQCTEIAFVIDTSQAVKGETYRFVVATEDGSAQHEGIWRGPATITEYPELTIATGVNDIIAKDSFMFGSYCGSDDSWICEEIDDDSTDDVGDYNSIAFDAEGDPWISYSNTTDTSLYVTQYVGSGGTGCETADWDCTLIENSPTAHGANSIGFDDNGVAWIAYHEISTSSLGVAQHVGSGGSGCNSTAWTCVTVDNGGDYGDDVALTFSENGFPVVVYSDTTNSELRFAEYVGGSDGVGCDVTDWTCTVIDDTVSVGVGADDSYGVEVDADSGTTWVSYKDETSDDLWVAQYVGVGGSGCTTGAWECVLVESTGAAGQHTDLALKANGSPVVSHKITGTSAGLNIAEYVGTGGSGCDSTAWDCTLVDDDGGNGHGTSVEIGADGTIMIVSSKPSNLELTIAISGAGGSGNCTSTAWICSDLDGDEVSDNSRLAFDRSGAAWISHHLESVGSGKLSIAKQALPGVGLLDNSYNNHDSGSAANGHARYILSQNDAAVETVPTCTNKTDYLGQCGVREVDSQFDIINVGIGAIGMFTFAKQSADNTTRPNVSWYGQSTISPSTLGLDGNLELQMYNFTDGDWEDVQSDTTTTGCDVTICKLQGEPTGSTVGDYFTADGSGGYFMNIRIIYYGDSSTTSSFRTDALTISQTNLRLRGNKTFDTEVITPFRP